MQSLRDFVNQYDINESSNEDKNILAVIKNIMKKVKSVDNADISAFKVKEKEEKVNEGIVKKIKISYAIAKIIASLCKACTEEFKSSIIGKVYSQVMLDKIIAGDEEYINSIYGMMTEYYPQYFDKSKDSIDVEKLVQKIQSAAKFLRSTIVKQIQKINPNFNKNV